jgi:predicted amidohydrolase
MEKEKIKISILQMSSIIGDVEANISKVESLVEKYMPIDTDVLVLPEVWTVGWSCYHFQNSAQDLEKGSVSVFLSKLARLYNINIIGGSFITVKDGRYYNTCPVYDRHGSLVASYSKMHLYSYYGCDEGSYITEGENPVMVNLDGVNYGLTICYDIRFPEIYRAYAKAGVDVLVNCAAWGSKKPIPWEMMTKSRAIENQCFMIALTQSGYIENGEYNLGESRIINYVGEEITSIMQGEGVASAVISISDMKKYRSLSPTVSDIKDNYEVKILCKS